ncbi:hypothetical protein NM688_g1118 [Phlebia brevispora]|uniref:Uncharacterized protein n=1 Tax=Phlebia brevispora TaxID=194682 RepID=A0ACC1TCD7_9APHY|nr:hypothetical protein NM688_g1118 [Phlebia brevispora]
MSSPQQSKLNHKRPGNKKGARSEQLGGKGGFSRPLTNHLPLTWLAPTTDRKLVSQAAIKESLTGGTFLDTKFYAFSRKRAGVVDKPMAIYANSAVLRHASKYFDELLAGSFKENSITSLDDPFPKDRPDFTEEYEYYSDSDLDEEEECEVEVGVVIASNLRSDVTVDNKTEENTSSLNDEVASENATGLVTVPEPSLEEKKFERDVNPQQVRRSKGEGKVIVLPDVAFNTLKALIFYIYTGDVAFAPLKSQTNANTINSAHTVDFSPYSAPPCSPKSIYRIADKYGLDDLKQKAANDIETKLSADNILQELFSTVTSMYDEIRTAQVAYASDWTVYESMSANIAPWIMHVASGELAHCEAVVSALFQQMAEHRKKERSDTVHWKAQYEAANLNAVNWEAHYGAEKAKADQLENTNRVKCSNCQIKIVATLAIYCSSCRFSQNVTFS